MKGGGSSLTLTKTTYVVLAPGGVAYAVLVQGLQGLINEAIIGVSCCGILFVTGVAGTFTLVTNEDLRAGG